MVQFNRPDLRERVRVGLKIAEQFGLDVDEQIHLTVPVADLISPNLFRGFPKGAWGRTAVGALGVGDSSIAFVQAVPDLGIIYNVTGLWVTGTYTGEVIISVGNADLSALTFFQVATAKAFTDARDTGVPDVFLGTAGPLQAAVPGQIVQIWAMDGDNVRFFPLDVVLGENAFIIIENGTTNEALDCCWQWTEYLLEDR